MVKKTKYNRKLSRKTRKRIHGGNAPISGSFGTYFHPQVPCTDDKEADAMLYTKRGTKIFNDHVMPSQVDDIYKTSIELKQKLSEKNKKVNVDDYFVFPIKECNIENENIKNRNVIVYPHASSDVFDEFDKIQNIVDLKENVEKLLNVLHGIQLLKTIGHAHCDIKIENCFYHEGKYKLGDLDTVHSVTEWPADQILPEANSVTYGVNPFFLFFYSNTSQVRGGFSVINDYRLKAIQSDRFDDFINYFQLFRNELLKHETQYKVYMYNHIMFKKILNFAQKVNTPETKNILNNIGMIYLERGLYLSNSNDPYNPQDVIVSKFLRRLYEKYNYSKDPTLQSRPELLSRVDVYSFGMMLINAIVCLVDNDVQPEDYEYISKLSSIIGKCCIYQDQDVPIQEIINDMNKLVSPDKKRKIVDYFSPKQKKSRSRSRSGSRRKTI